MTKHFRILSAAGALAAMLAAGPVRADLSSVGGLGSAARFSATDKTYVDVTRGATATGTYSSATVYWITGGSGCSGSLSFMLKFYHPDAATGESLSFITERGPFSGPEGFVDVTLSPAVSLQQGDYVGLTELGPCGAVEMLLAGGNQTLQFEGDSGTADITLCDQSFATLIPESLGVIVRGSGTANRAGIVLGVGSVQGAAGSNFKTSMQLLNPDVSSVAGIQGRLVFRALGKPGGPSDPSLAYSIPNGQAISFPDIVAAIGGSGLGSIDVIAESSNAPLVVTRIFNDGGAAGTAGFSEPMIRPGDEFVLQQSDTAYLFAPNDPAKFRMNLAIRSLDFSTTLVLTVSGPDGSFVAQVTKTYDPDVFDLESTAQLFPGATIGANDIIQVAVTAGRAIVGGVAVDNKTNDTALQLGTRKQF